MRDYKHILKILSICALLLPFAMQSYAQDFMLQGWYWDYPKTCDSFNWADSLKAKVNDLQTGGITYVWLPPLSRASFGSCSNGYDPKDLYDLGEFGGGATGFGTRTDVDELITALTNAGINSVADVVYNHRDGGSAETNNAVKDYITTHYTAAKNPFPSDRFRCRLSLGGASGNGAGDYYFKISSKSGDSKFYNKPYKVYMETSAVGWQSQADGAESEPNGGGDCGEPSNTISLGKNWNANLDGLGCLTDEFKLTISASDFNAAGDELYIYLTNSNGDYSDHRIYGIWNASASADIVSQLVYETYTDFTSMPSGQGSMNFENFKPNSSNTATTFLTGDWDWLWFFYDYDQSQAATQTALQTWSKWLWDDVKIRGFRMDAVKHFDNAFTGDLFDYLHGQGIDPGMVVGEYFDTNAGTLKGWVDNVTTNMNTATINAINVRAFDFALREALKNACDQFGYDVRNVFSSGMVDGAGANAFNVVTFVNNHDYRNAGEPVQNDPALAYAYLLTNNQIGLPSIFYPEYFGKSVTNYPVINIKTRINELINAHKTHIYQATRRDYLSRNGTPFSATFNGGFNTTTLLYQIEGGISGKEVLVCINFAGEALDVTHGINGNIDGIGGNNFAIGQTFNELFSYSTSPTLTVDDNFAVNIKLPARSYSIWVEGSVLPLELTQFQAIPKKDAVTINWRTASEIQVKGFELQRSLDGKIFTPINWQDSKGLENAAYTYLDKNILFNHPLYYRLKMMDLDGTFSYSEIEIVELEREDGLLKIYPNPVEDELFLEMENGTAGMARVEIYNYLGMKVQEESIQIESGKNQILVKVKGLDDGVYFLILEHSKGRYQQKFVK